MATASVTPPRLISIDVYRGLVMFLMMAEVLSLASVAKSLPESSLWKFAALQQTHVEWIGCTLHDLIQPSFSFLVGISLPFSLAARAGRGDSALRQTLHAGWRAMLLVALGIFLRSVGRKQTNFVFEDTLSQIGLGYLFLYLLARTSVRIQWLAIAVIVLGFWGLFAFSSMTPADYPNMAKYGVPENWPHLMDGFESHWNKNANPTWAFDVWFLNQFPRETPFLFNGGGYGTLSFIPTLATMLLGLIAGGMLRSEHTPAIRAGRLILLGVVLLAVGYGIGQAGVCPVVKRIWTPSWVLFSGGWCFMLMGAFYFLLESRPWSWLGWPLMVIGVNSIAAYVLKGLLTPFIRETLRTHLGAEHFRRFGPEYEPFILGTEILLVLWLILLWMYRRKIFLKI